MTTQKSQKIALERYNNGEEYSVSTSIDEDSIIAGYGELGYTEFEFPLPIYKIIEIYGTTSWKQHLKNKNINQYLTINNQNKIESISPYWTDEEFQKHKELNPDFKFEKL